MSQEKPRRWPAAVAILGALLLAGCTPARRGAPSEGGADGFHDAAWGGGQDCAGWDFAAPRWTPSWPVVWSAQAPLPPRAMAALAAESEMIEGGADGFTQTGVLPRNAGCALPAAAWLPLLAPGGLAWSPLRQPAGGGAEEGGDPAGEVDGDPRLLPGELAAIGRDFGHGRRPGTPLGADDLHGPYLLLWPGAAAAAGQGGGGGGGSPGGEPAEPGTQDGPPVETIPVGETAPILAPVIGAATIPEPATMALLGAALIGLGLLRRWD